MSYPLESLLRPAYELRAAAVSALAAAGVMTKPPTFLLTREPRQLIKNMIYCTIVSAVCFVDALRGWAAGAGGVLRTADGGATWTPGTSVIVPAPADHSNDGVHVYRCRAIDNIGNISDTVIITVRISTL